MSKIPDLCRLIDLIGAPWAGLVVLEDLVDSACHLISGQLAPVCLGMVIYLILDGSVDGGGWERPLPAIAAT